MEPDSKKRREDMDEDEKKKFDDWLDEIRNKLSDIKEKKQSRLLRRQQMAKRRTAASQELSWSWIFKKFRNGNVDIKTCVYTYEFGLLNDQVLVLEFL